MSEINITIDGGTSKKLLTAGKFCDKNIVVTAIGGGGSEDCNGLHIPDEALEISGDCSYKFQKGGWDWFIEMCGDKITTKSVMNAQKMFSGSSLQEIPFDINIANIADGCSVTSIFDGSYITKPPYIKGKIIQPEKMFLNCTFLTTIPDDWADYIDWDKVHTNSSHSMTNIFSGCKSLRKIPDNLLSNLWSTTTGYYYAVYYGMIPTCYVMDELKNVPVLTGTLVNNCFNGSFSENNRLKSFTFATNEDGTPKTANWKNQTINLHPMMGYAQSLSNITRQSDYHGITADKEVKDDATYQALKNDPDWFTCKPAYSRYNHDSAVETINSLPDTSAYLATAGGTNTIKFTSNAGSATDGGGIGTLTEEEIAVATAKGWTVTFASV